MTQTKAQAKANQTTQIDTIDQAFQQLEFTLTQDRFRLKKRLKKMIAANTTQSIDWQQLQQSSRWQQWETALRQSQQKVQQRQAKRPEVHYPALPVAERKETLVSLIKQHPVVVIAGETGSGKTTQIPKMCLDAGRGVFGRIGCTQPRRLAAKSVAERLSQELDSRLGDLVGYQVRFHDQTHSDSLLKVMTDGILLAEVQNDPFLNQYDTLIIDEAHERSINIDFLLGILKKLLKKRPDLKLIITSATIDTQRFSDHFDQAPIIEVSGRTYPVEIRYRPLETHKDDQGQTFEQDEPQAIVHALEELREIDPFGDVLVFQVGERDIKETAQVLKKSKLPNTEVVPLYARLSMSEQNKVFQTSQKRRIILATNVAETSLTVPGIRFVIDPGRVRISRYSVRSQVQRLPIERISQASANQRAGRCGRVSDGVCIRLYDQADFESRPAFTPPEIHRTSLATVILQMTQMRLGQVKHFPFIEPPEEKAINDGFRQLQALGALDAKKHLTDTGRQLARLPLDPRMAKMVLAGQDNGVLYEVLVVATALSIQDPRDINEANRQAAQTAHQAWQDERSDFLFFLNLWHFYETQRRHLSQNKLRKLCKTHFLSYMRMKEWHDLFFQIEVNLKRQGIRINDPQLYETTGQGKQTQMRLSEMHATAVHRSLLTGLLGNIAVRDDENSYLGTRNTKVYIHPSSVLFKRKPKWLVSGELVETSKIFARHNATIDVRWIEQLAGHLVKRQYDDPHWQKKRGQVGAYESVTLYGLPIVNRRRCNYGPIHPKEAHKIFIRHALVEGEMRTQLGFFQHNLKLIASIEHIESKLRRPDFLVEPDQLYDFYFERIPKHIYNQPALETWVRNTQKTHPEQIEALYFKKEDLLKQAIDTQDLAQAFPDQITLKNQLPLAVDYHFEPGRTQDGMEVKVPLNQLNQLQAKDFEWLTPGLLEQKIIHLIKQLPKSLRKQFIPAPATASQIMTEISPEKKINHQAADLTAQLVWALNRRAQKRVTYQDLADIPLPAHCEPYYTLLDQNDQVIAHSGDLSQLKDNYQHLVQKALKKAVKNEARPVEAWDFGDLPEKESLNTRNGQLWVYPSLRVHQAQIQLDQLTDPQQAQQQHGQGVIALIKRQKADKYRYLQKKLPLKKACLCFAPYGTCQQLTEQIIDRALTRLVPEPEHIRQQNVFEQALREVQSQWVAQAQALSDSITQILQAHQKVAKRIKAQKNPRLLGAISDIKDQLDHLVWAEFVQQTPDTWLQQLPRYLQGLEKRLDKIELNPAKDLEALQQLKPVLARYRQLAQDPAYQGQPGLVAIRWQLEELRISLFAQPIKTLKPVSIKRIQKQMDAL